MPGPGCECGHCPTCYKRAWRARNPEKVKNAKAKWGRTRDRAGDEKALEYSRRYRDENPEKIAEYNRSRDKRKIRARNILNAALRYGKLERGTCEVCGEGKAQAHHDDYDKPLEVKWLCPRHHAQYHRDRE